MPSQSSRKTGIVLLAALVVMGIAAISYVAIDKYVLDRADASAPSSTQEASDAQGDSTTGAVSTTTEAGSGEAPAGDTATSSSSTASSAEPTVTDTSYSDATKSISIAKVVTGSGESTVTYYVADVQLSTATDMQAAPAGGEFGARATADTSDIAAANDALLAINGDYFGARDDGVIIRNGVLYRNVPTRIGLALYKDGTMKVYDETEVSADELLADGVWNAYSFGPALLDDGVMPDNLDYVEVEANPRHPIQGHNPRTGIGIIDANHFVLIVVDGRKAGYSMGMTLTEFAQIFKDLGCTTAYNLDGGGSSTMYFMGGLVNEPLGTSGQRAISDILMIK
jgi:exopolysaccharide biosynthesis protein